jgi:chromosome segregation protein
VADCPPELAARLALVQVAEVDDGRALPPGVWLVTLAGHVRRWDGFVARGEGAAEAARLEADNRFAALEAEVPPLREAATNAEAQTGATAAALAQAQAAALPPSAKWPPPPRPSARALRALDAAEAARERLATRRAELAEAAQDLAAQRDAAPPSMRPRNPPRRAARARCGPRCWKPQRPARGRAGAHQAATARLAAQDQALAVARER